MAKQVRLEGRVEVVSAEEADAYWKHRPRESQLGAWASQQSRPLPSRETLLAEVKKVEQKFSGQEIPRPPFWIGYRLILERVELWVADPHRLNDRTLFEQRGGRWVMEKLYP